MRAVAISASWLRQRRFLQQELAGQAFNALLENDYGQYDELIGVLSPTLGPTGLDQLKQRFVELSKAPRESSKGKERKVIGWGGGGPLYADEMAERHRESVIHLALQEIADAQGDVDAFIAQQSEKARTVPKIAAEIARRLLKAGRSKEAWTAINAVDESKAGWIPCDSGIGPARGDGGAWAQGGGASIPLAVF